MDTNLLLVGNMFVASVCIKTIVSAAKKVFPSLIKKPKILKGSSMLLGIFVAFIIDAQLFDLAASGEPVGAFPAIVQKVLAGLFIGAASIGVHETVKGTKN